MSEENRPDPKKSEARRIRSRRRARLAVAVPVLALHLGLFMLLFSTAPRLLPEALTPETIVAAELFTPPPPPPPPPSPKPDGPPKASTVAPAAPVETQTPKSAKPPPPRHIVRTPPPPEVQPIPAAPPRPPQPNVVLSEASLAGATVAGPGTGGGSGGTGQGGGGSGGDCDMVRRLQDALRDDPEVRSAMTQVHRSVGPGKAVLVWNRDWMPSPGQDGRGLARVRQAIAMEVAFAPEACKTRPMRGLVVISFADGPGAPKLALGGGAWRWTELLSARR